MRTADFLLYLTIFAGLASLVFALWNDWAVLFHRRGRERGGGTFPFCEPLIGKTLFQSAYDPMKKGGSGGNVTVEQACEGVEKAIERYENVKEAQSKGEETTRARQELAKSVEILYQSFTRARFRSDEMLRRRVNDLLDKVWEATRGERKDTPQGGCSQQPSRGGQMG